MTMSVDRARGRARGQRWMRGRLVFVALTTLGWGPGGQAPPRIPELRGAVEEEALAFDSLSAPPAASDTFTYEWDEIVRPGPVRWR